MSSLPDIRPKASRLEYLALFLGNLLEHYDKALYALLAPYIASLFFPSSTPALTLAFFFLPLSFLIKPFGALFIGKYGDLISTQKALLISLVGISISTSLIGLIPPYHNIGIFSPVLLYFFRLCMDFFSVGERSGAILVILDYTEEKNKTFVSSLYESTAMIGYLLASCCIGLLYYFDALMLYWRFLFLSSLLTGACGFYLRSYHHLNKKEEPLSKLKLREAIKISKAPFISIILMVGFSYANYEIIIKMLHSLFSLDTHLNKSSILLSTSSVVLFDLLLFPFFGLLSKKIDSEKLIRYSLLFTFALAPPLFYLLKTPTYGNILFVRCTLILLGVAHASTLQYWMVSKLPKERRYTLLALGKALGACLIGHPSVSLSLWLYERTKLILIPGIYISLTALAAFISLHYLKNKSLEENL